MLRIGPAAERCRGREPHAGFFSANLSSYVTRANCIPGNEIVRPETLVKMGGSLSQETVKSPWETRLVPPTCGTNGLFQSVGRLASPGRLAGGGGSLAKRLCGMNCASYRESTGKIHEF